MSRGGGVVAIIRRVPPLVLWAVLSAAWVAFLRLAEPDSMGFQYLILPVSLGVTLIADRARLRRYRTWLPPLIGFSVSLLVVLIGKALS